MKPVIFHVDVNAAFLSWEAVYRLYHKGGTVDLREIPSAVAGDAGLRRGIILAKSMPAKRYGIQTGESIPEAKRKCPKLMLAAPNYNLYERCSAALMALLREYSDTVEPYSIDEAFVDMTQTCHLFGQPEQAAEIIKNRVRRELGFTVNIGVSENKLLAKMASDFRKPDRVHTLWRSEIQRKMWPLAVSELFFVGRATAKKLFSVGIRTIGELAQTDPVYMKSILKKQGEIVWAFANGLDSSPVLKDAPANKGYGNSTTIPFDVTDAPTAKKVLLALSETVAARLRADGVQIGVIAVGIKDTDFSYRSHQRVLAVPTHITLEIYQTACALFDELWDQRPIRHLGVHTSGVHGENFTRQMSLFDKTDYEKLKRLDAAVDAVRGRFGADALMRAAFLGQPIDHMSGGDLKGKERGRLQQNETGMKMVGERHFAISEAGREACAMAFGIGKERQTGRGQTGHAGQIRGRQQEAACECWFTSTGKMMPLMLKVKDEDGECRTIRPVIVHSSEKKMYAGTPFIEFDCEITVGERQMNVWLIYYQNENRWVLNFR